MFKTLSKRSVFAGAAAAGIAGAGYFGFNNRRFFSAEAEQKSALNPNEFTGFKLQEVHPITHNVKLFRFALPEKDQDLGTFVASAVVVFVIYKIIFLTHHEFFLARQTLTARTFFAHTPQHHHLMLRATLT